MNVMCFWYHLVSFNCPENTAQGWIPLSLKCQFSISEDQISPSFYFEFFFFDRTIVPQTSRSLSSEILTRLIKDEDNQAFLPPLHQGPGRTTHTCQQRGLLYNLVLEGASFRAASDLHEASYPFSCEPSVLSSLVAARLGEVPRAGCGPSLPEHPPCRGLVNSNARSSLRNSPYPLQTLT